MGNDSHTNAGKDFQLMTSVTACKYFGKRFIEEKAVLIGNPPKEHRFDLVSEDNQIVIECKNYKWTEGNNIPSAKLSTINEAVLYMRNLPDKTHKILTLKKDVRPSTAESLAEYYCRINGHLLNDIEVWEIDSVDSIRILRR